MSEWKHGLFGCLDSGAGFCCIKMYCLGCCTLGKVWEAYEMPGGCPVGCLCGQGLCCAVMLRQKIAQSQNIDDGMMAFILPCCCTACSMWQVVQEAKDAGKLPDGGPEAVEMAGAPAVVEMTK